MVADSTALYYNILLSDVNLLAIIVLVGFVVVGPVSIWFLDKYGLRVGVSLEHTSTCLDISFALFSSISIILS